MDRLALDPWARRRGVEAVDRIGAAAKAHLVELERRPVRRRGQTARIADRTPVPAVERRRVMGPGVVGEIVGPLVDVARLVVGAERADAVGMRADAIGLPQPRELALAGGGV